MAMLRRWYLWLRWLYGLLWAFGLLGVVAKRAVRSGIEGGDSSGPLVRSKLHTQQGMK
jgi:hypothetical protein